MTKNILNKKIGNNLRVLRNFNFLDQQYLAKKLSISQPDYSNIENGKTSLCLKKAKAIELLYNLPIDTILNSSEDELLELLILKKKAEKVEIGTKQKQLKQKPINKATSILDFEMASTFSSELSNLEINEDDFHAQIEWLQQGLSFIKYQYIQLRLKV